MKKKALSLLLAMAMVFTAAVNVFAGDTKIEFEQSTYSYDYNKGDTFDVKLLITDNDGFNTMQFFLKYDPTVIQAVEAGSVADDYIGFEDGNGYKQEFLSSSMINNQINLVPGSTNEEYEGKSDNRSTASEIGIVKLASYVTASDSNLRLKVIEDTGTLCTIKFKIVGQGTTSLEAADAKLSVVSDSIDAWSEDVAPATVVIGNGTSNNDSQTATDTSTETTTSTSSSSSSSSGGSGGGSGTNTVTTTEVVTIDEETEATTEGVTEATTAEISFSDISDYPWAVDYINKLASKGIVNGYADGTFRPADNVKRADFIIMVVGAIGADATVTDNFDDVPEGAYYYNAVGVAKALGIASGNGDGTFSPNSYITRQDMMIIAKKALETASDKTISGDLSVLDKFADSDSISEYAKESLAAMVSEGIVNGTGSNIEPKNNTTRAQAAVIISNILDKI